MGWTFSHSTRSELIRELTHLNETAEARYETLAYALRGNVLWSVIRITRTCTRTSANGTDHLGTFIACHLLTRADSRWGYKPMDESMHPYYYTCPLTYLAMAPEQSQKWRERVRAYHARRCSKALPAASMA